MNSLSPLETKTGRKIALYLRTASQDQENPQESLEAQEKKLRNLVRSRNRRGRFGRIAGLFADPGYSGMDSNRPALKALLEAVRRNEIDVVLVSDVARLSRSMKQLIDLMTSMAAHQCQLETCLGHIPLGTAVDLYQGRGRK